MRGLVMLDARGRVLSSSMTRADQSKAYERNRVEDTLGREKLIDITRNPRSWILSWG